MKKEFLKILVFSLIGLFSIADAQDEPLKMGNFILSDSQQPGPFISFGENIIEKHQTQLFFFADDFSGKNKYIVDLIPSILYGISDKFSVFFALPVAASLKI